MSESIEAIKKNIDTDYLSEYLGEKFAEDLEFTDYNIEILKISINDLKSETYSGIEHVEYIENEDWEKLKSLVSEEEVKAIREEFKEDSEYYKNENESNNPPSIYKAILYCNEEYVWSATTYSEKGY